MATTRKLETKSGGIVYEIAVSRGRGKTPFTTRWHAPDGWSQRSIDKGLAKEAADFERRCKAGQVLTKKEQREKALQAQQEAAKVLTLRQYGETVFMPAKAVTMAENSRSSFQGNLDKWIYPALGDLKMPDITAANISALLLSMQSQGKAHSTVVKCYSILNILFKMAYMTDVVTRNPMDKVARPRPRKDELAKDGVEACTVQEARAVLDYLNQEPLKWRTLIRLLIDTGVRRGECCALQWKDIDFQANTITFCDNLCYTPAKGVYVDTPKNRRKRVIDIDPEIMGLLRLLRAEQSKTAISPFVFTQDGSPDPIHPQSPTRYLAKFSKRCGISHLHPHKLRHSFASIAITNGADIASVSEKLGHSDKAVTLRMYTHADEESIKRAGDIFRSAIKQA